MVVVSDQSNVANDGQQIPKFEKDGRSSVPGPASSAWAWAAATTHVRASAWGAAAAVRAIINRRLLSVTKIVFTEALRGTAIISPGQVCLGPGLGSRR